MAFVNERLTEDQRTAFSALKITDPRPPLTYGSLTTSYRTVDYSNNMYLIYAGVFHGAPKEHYFVFFKGEEQFVFSLMRGNFGDGFIWYTRRQFSPYSLPQNTDLLECIKNALLVFMIDGTLNSYNKNVDIVCDF